MAARSVQVNFENYLDSNLSLNPNSVVLDHGIWDSQPPSSIPKAEGGAPGKGSWTTESNGFATGTEGSCTYAFYDSRTEQVFYIDIHWDNPFTGSNAYSISTGCNSVDVSYSGGSGDNATVTFKAVRK